MKNGVYQIRNLINGKRYIGSTADKKGFMARWSKHRLDLERDIHHSIKLQRAWKKYGADAFVFEIVLYCDPINCLMYEQISINHFKPEYNVSKIAGSPLGVKHTKQARANMSAAHQGIFDGCKNPFFGKRHSKTTRDQISKTRSGKCTGKSNANVRLTASNVKRIRQMLNDGISQSEIASTFGVAQTTISLIHLRKTWSYIS